MLALQDRVAWVTGSSRGIGAAIAKLFARHGAKVAIHGRDVAALAAVHSELAGAGHRVIEVAGDLGKLADVDAMRATIEAELGPIDILVANAGGNFALGPIEEMSEEAWRASVDGNLTATFFTIKSVLPGMKQRRRGNIVTMSSAAGHRASAKSPIGYAAAKAGIEMMTKDVAAQAGPFGVRVNCVAPETILTERNEARIPPAMKTAMAAAHPLERLGTPDDVAHAALFLASDDAGWITGIVLDVAGGA